MRCLMVTIRYLKEKADALPAASPFVIVDKSFDMHRYSQSLGHFKLSKIEKKLIFWIMGCPAMELYSLPDYCQANDIKLMSARVALNHLVSYGLLSILHIPIITGGKKYRNCYVLKDVNFEAVIAPQEKKKVSSAVLRMEKAIPKIEPSYALVDNLICGVLAPCLPLVKKKNVKFESTIRWFGKPLVMITSSTHDEYVAEIDDLKTYIAILSCTELLIKHHITQNESIPDAFCLTLNQIANARGFHSKMSDNSRNSLRLSIDRLRHTKFEITTSDYSFNKIVGNLADNYLVEINPISNAMFYLAEKGSQSLHMVEFQLPKIIRDALLSRIKNNIQGEFEALPLLTYDQDPLLLILKKHIERFYMGNVLIFDWVQLKNLLSQPSTLTNFRARMFKLAEKISGAPSSVFESRYAEFKFDYENIHCAYKDNKWSFKLNKQHQNRTIPASQI